MRRAIFLAMIFGLVSTPSAHAHRLDLEVTTKNEQLVIEAFYPEFDESARGALIEISTADGSVLRSGRTDENGFWRTTLLEPGTYTITAATSDGHKAKKPYTVTAPDLPPTTPPTITDVWPLWTRVLCGFAIILLLCVVLRFVKRASTAKTTL